MRKLIVILCGLGILTASVMAQNNLNAGISEKNGVSILTINGKEKVPELIYHTLETKPAFRSALSKGLNPSAELIKLARKHGFHLTTMFMPIIWPKDGNSADYSALDKIMDKHIELDPQFMAIPRLRATPPAWWLKKNPSELMKFKTSKGNGELSPRRRKAVARYAAPTSEKWRKDYYNALRLQVRYLEKKYGNHILGYHPGTQSCGENFFALAWDRVNPSMAGFSESFRQGFIKYVMNKYGSINKVNQAWRTTLKSFNDIRVPTMKERVDGEDGAFRNPETQRFVIDFMTYFQRPIFEVCIHSAKIIKEETKNKKLVVLFYTSPQSGHPPLGPSQRGGGSLQEILDCPDVDIICNPYDYRNRQHGGVGLVNNMIDSIIAHGKMYFVEDDTRTHTAPYNHFGKTANMKESKEVFIRMLPQLLQYNLGHWLFDFGSGYDAQPELFELFEKMRKIRENFKTKPFRPEIALVFDTVSSLYLRGSNEVSIHFFNMMRDYPLMGAPFGRYLLSDVCAGKVPPETKVLFFLNAYKIDDKQRKQLHKALADGGKTAVWFHAPGYIDGKKASVENIFKTTGIAVERMKKPVAARYELTKNYSNLKKGHIFGVYNKLSTLFKIKTHQKGVSYLAKYEKSQNPALAVKRMGNWTSILFCGVRFGPEIFRAIAKENGAHIFCNSNDSISGSSNFIAITAIGNGEKTLYFKNKVNLSDIFTGEKVASGVKQYTLTMNKGETRIFLKK